MTTPTLAAELPIQQPKSPREIFNEDAKGTFDGYIDPEITIFDQGTFERFGYTIVRPENFELEDNITAAQMARDTVLGKAAGSSNLVRKVNEDLANELREKRRENPSIEKSIADAYRQNSDKYVAAIAAMYMDVSSKLNVGSFAELLSIYGDDLDSIIAWLTNLQEGVYDGFKREEIEPYEPEIIEVDGKRGMKAPKELEKIYGIKMIPFVQGSTPDFVSSVQPFIAEKKEVHYALGVIVPNSAMSLEDLSANQIKSLVGEVLFISKMLVVANNFGAAAIYRNSDIEFQTLLINQLQNPLTVAKNNAEYIHEQIKLGLYIDLEWKDRSEEGLRIVINKYLSDNPGVELYKLCYPDGLLTWFRDRQLIKHIAQNAQIGHK